MSEVWKAEVCDGLDPKFVAKIFGERKMLERAADGRQIVKQIERAKMRAADLGRIPPAG
jgi:hypothetical protein